MALYIGNKKVTPIKVTGVQEINNQDKTITQNGTYTADIGYTGLGTVNVNVSGGGGDTPEWQPNPEWWDIKTILEQDTRDYVGKAIILYSNSDDFTRIIISSPLIAVATSDGAFYTSTANHTWDKSKDKIVSSDTGDTTPKYGTRYLILYFNTVDVDYTAFDYFYNSSIYAIFGCNLTKNSSSMVSLNTFFYKNFTLQSFDFLYNFNLKFGTNFSYFCSNCYSLTKVNIKLGTVSITTLSNSKSISIDSLRYIADNAPTVATATTLTIGQANITRTGGADGYVVQTLTSKGWTVN